MPPKKPHPTPDDVWTKLAAAGVSRAAVARSMASVEVAKGGGMGEVGTGREGVYVATRTSLQEALDELATDGPARVLLGPQRLDAREALRDAIEALTPLIDLYERGVDRAIIAHTTGEELIGGPGDSSRFTSLERLAVALQDVGGLSPTEIAVLFVEYIDPRVQRSYAPQNVPEEVSRDLIVTRVARSLSAGMAGIRRERGVRPA